MKNLLVGSILLSSLASAQSKDWGAGLFYTFADKESSAVTRFQFDTLDKVLGTGSSLDLDWFAGENTHTKKPVGGVDVSKSWAVATRVKFTAGLGAAVQDERLFSFGVLLAVSYTAKPVQIVLSNAGIAFGAGWKF